MRWPTLSGSTANPNQSSDAVADDGGIGCEPPGARFSEGRRYDGSADDRLDRLFVYALFAAVLIANIVLTTQCWRYGFLIGHEFRQSQTALITRYIDEQSNFSLHYETPVFGKPWEVPLEFPLYQWAVVGLSRLTHWPHFVAARTVSFAAIYLAAPAIFLLLGHAGLARHRRLLVLALYLATPVYIFYGRSFLMDTTAMMFSAWFLAAFVEMMRTRKIGWLLVCTIAAAAAGLIKSITWFVWLVPAAVYGAWCLWQDLKEKRGGAAVVRTIAWGVGAVIGPVIAVSWWIRFTDAIKAKHPSGHIFTSEGLTRGNFGMYDLSVRFSKATWSALLYCWEVALAHPWAIGAAVLLGVALLRGFRVRILAAFALFLTGQLLFPNAYAYQDYYFTACAVFFACTFGFIVNGVLSSPLPRWCRWPLVLLPFAACYVAYAGYYYPQHQIKSHGGTGLTIALRDFLPSTSVLIVDGNDWAPIIPYYSKHRALMIRNGLDRDPKYLDRAFDDINDEDVSALVMIGDFRTNRYLVDRATSRFNLDKEPTFRYHNADIYVSDIYREQVLNRLRSPPLPENITFDDARVAQSITNEGVHPIATSASARVFPMIHPAPYQFSFKFGYDLWTIDGQAVMSAHPDAAVWIKPPDGAREIVMEYGMRREVWEGKDKSDGVDFVIEAQGKETRRVLFSRYLNPAEEAADRGMQRSVVPVTLNPDETLVFRTQRHAGYAYDWCFWKSIDVR